MLLLEAGVICVIVCLFSVVVFCGFVWIRCCLGISLFCLLLVDVLWFCFRYFG